MNAIIALSWVALGLDSLWVARRTRSARAALGDVVRTGFRPPAVLAPIVIVVLIVGIGVLERLAGRLPFRPWLGGIGLLLVGGGLALHAIARRALGSHWSRAVEVRERQTLVQEGPYARVRHPLYLAVLLMGIGTFLAHPSIARAAVAWGLAIGLAIKIRIEERTLAEAFGSEWRRYAARVPALVPRLRGGVTS